MRILVVTLLAAVGLHAEAQPVDGADAITKRVYNLAPPSEEEEPAVGALRRTEYEFFGPDGRRLRVEWRAPDGGVTLAFMEPYGDSDRPYGAVYFEGTDLDPTLERFEYRDGETPGTTVRRVTYTGADGVVTSINEFVLDDDGRELERRYGNAEGVFGATDTVRYDGRNQTGYVFERVDGSRRRVYAYRNETFDERGHRTSRVVLRDGEPRLFETRAISYRTP